MYWLHFIGKSFYKTPEDFISEATLYRVSRRVSLPLLSGFSWGDRVFLAMGGFKTSRRVNPLPETVCFGYFDVDGIGGLSPEAAQDLAKAFGGTYTRRPGGTSISRGCGSYLVLGTVTLPPGVALKEIARFLRDGKYVLPGLSLQGNLVEIRPYKVVPWTFRFGYTRLDLSQILEQGLPIVWEDTQVGESKGEVVQDYSFRDLWGSGKTAW